MAKPKKGSRPKYGKKTPAANAPSARPVPASPPAPSLLSVLRYASTEAALHEQVLACVRSEAWRDRLHWADVTPAQLGNLRQWVLHGPVADEHWRSAFLAWVKTLETGGKWEKEALDRLRELADADTFWRAIDVENVPAPELELPHTPSLWRRSLQTLMVSALRADARSRS